MHLGNHSETSQPAKRLTLKDILLLLAATVAVMAVHGYHPYVEDAEIYLPGIKKLVNPALYPQNTGFFASHAGMTLFPNIIAASVRWSHLPFDWALLIWQFACIFLLLLACWKIGNVAFQSSTASWGGVALLAAMLTIPVAGTALYIMDQYLNTRSLSAATVLMMVASVAERRYGRAAIWALAMACVHPLMTVFGVSFAAVLVLIRSRARFGTLSTAAMILALPTGFFPPMTQAYHEALQSRPYFFLQRWAWYEYIGMVAPFVIFWWFGKLARKFQWPELATLSLAANVFGLLFAIASVLTIPSAFERFTLLQPVRYLHLTYVLMFALGGGLLAHFVLKNHAWRWLVLFMPMCAGMFYSQRQVFSASPHLELPGVSSPNPWVQAFLWIKSNTPNDAFFALNPNHMALPGEDQHGFRALSERSMLADNVKDSGAVVMFAKLAETWKEQSAAQANWATFQKADFERLKRTYGINWVVLEKPTTLQFVCPYENERVLVCRLE